MIIHLLKILTSLLLISQDGYMAASVLSFFCCFCLFCVSHSSSITFTRDKLLNIQQHIPDNIFPVFDYADVLLEGQRYCSNAWSDADGGNAQACWLSTANATFALRSQVFILRMSNTLLKQWMNFSPALTSNSETNFQTLLH